MSGIVGIWNIDGAPVDPVLLGRMTDRMAFRGPDAQKSWIDSESRSIGFGHTLLKTTYEAEFENQPFTLDGKVWIVADARVDAQDELISKLNAKRGTTHANAEWLTDPKRLLDSSGGRRQASGDSGGPFKKGAVTDVELILRAYALWGEDCVEHLLGDFAFAIWDGPRKKLFCARDHFGVKPFYYAHLGQTWIFSNTLDCVRLHPKVSDERNDLAIADFLLFDMNQDPATTTFRDIQALPAAHKLSIGADGPLKIERYWSIPFDEPIRLRSTRDYADAFRELLENSVADRSRMKKIAIYMSGGLDSTTAAAIARGHSDVHAFTVVYDRLIPDKERYYSTLAGKALGIPVRHLAADDYKLYERWDDPSLRAPEPEHNPGKAISADQFLQVSEHSRVAFYCEGPDNALHYEWRPYLSALFAQGRWGRFALDLGHHFAAHRRVPLVRGLWNRLSDRLSGQANSSDSPDFPRWLNAHFVSRLHLEDRWKALEHNPVSQHPYRAKACTSFAISNWRYLLESCDPGCSGIAVETRYPFLDVRLLRFLLAVPPIPWCADKLIERESMRGILPEIIRRRPKEPLAGDPTSVKLQRDPDWRSRLPKLVPDMMEYIDAEAFEQESQQERRTVWSDWTRLRPLSLNQWLHGDGAHRRDGKLRAHSGQTDNQREHDREIRTYQEAV